MMKNKSSFLAALWWVLALAVTGALILCFAPKDSRVSEKENRMLQGMPELTSESVFSGEYSGSFELYLSDSFWGRDSLISVSDRLLGLLSMTTAEDDYLLDSTEEEVASFGEEDDSDTTEAVLSEEVTEPSGEEAPTAEDGGCSLWLEQNDGGTLTLYKYPFENIQTVADTLEMYLEVLPEDGGIYYTQVPFPKLARRWTGNRAEYCGWGSDLEARLDSLTDSRIRFFSTPDILEPHLQEGETLYFYEDHHWTAHGAYYVFAEMIASQGLPVTPFSEYGYTVNTNIIDANRSDSFELLYPLYPTHSMVVSSSGEKEIEVMAYTSRTYVSFIYGTQTPWRRFETGSNTGRKALVIGDSFSNALTPYLFPYYDEVHMTDLRPTYYDRDALGASVEELTRANGIDDIYIIYSEANDVNSNAQLIHLRKNFFE